MSATVVAVVPLTRAVQYDGTNSADVDAAITDFTIVSEGGGNLTFESNGGQHVCPTNGHIVYNQSGIVIEAVSAGVYASNYCVVPAAAQLGELAGDVAALSDSVTALEGSLDAIPAGVAAAGARTFAAIIASQSANVDVPIVPAMPDSNYTAAAVVFGGVNIVDLHINSITVIDADTVRVQVQNVGLISLGASVLVTATPN